MVHPCSQHASEAAALAALAAAESERRERTVWCFPDHDGAS